MCSLWTYNDRWLVASCMFVEKLELEYKSFVYFILTHGALVKIKP